MQRSRSRASSTGNERRPGARRAPRAARCGGGHRPRCRDPPSRGARPGFPDRRGHVRSVGRAARGDRSRSLLRARLFQRLPARLPVRVVAPRCALRRRAPSACGQSDQHPRRHRDRCPSRARAQAHGRAHLSDRRRCNLDTPAGCDLRGTVLGPGRCGGDPTALRLHRRRRVAAMVARRRPRDPCRACEAPVRHRAPRDRRGSGVRVRSRSAVAPPRSDARRRRRDRLRALGPVLGPRPHAHRGRARSAGPQRVGDLPLHVALRVQPVVGLLRLLEIGHGSRVLGRSPARDRTDRVGDPPLVAAGHGNASGVCRARRPRVLLPPDTRARALPLPGLRARAPARRRAHARVGALRGARAHLRVVALLRVHAVRAVRGSARSADHRSDHLQPSRSNRDRARDDGRRRVPGLASRAWRRAPRERLCLGRPRRTHAR